MKLAGQFSFFSWQCWITGGSGGCRDISSGGLVASAAALKYYLNERTPKGCAKVRGSGWLGVLGALPEMWKCILKYEAHSHWA